MVVILMMCLQEEPYEWGNPNAGMLGTLKPSDLEYKLVCASRKWRIKIQQSAGEVVGAYQGMRALIHTSQERIGAYTRLIEAGGGTVITAR